MRRSYLPTAILIIVHIHGTPAQSPPCPVDPPCHCDWRVIQCGSGRLTHIPHFKTTNGTNWWVYLYLNNITVIPSRAFSNLKGIYYMSLNNNAITSIADDAFVGSEDTLNFLSITSNQLRYLPYAIGRLRALTQLYIDDNPLSAFDPEVFQALSPSLQYLTLGSEELTEWPTSMQFLNNLTTLSLYHSPMEELPTYAFLGLSNLQTFNIGYCGITSLPVTLNMLTSLEVFSVNSNPKLTLSGIPRAAFSGLYNLNTLWIINQTFVALPDIFHDAFSLRGLTINLTPIRVFDQQMIPDNSPMTSINFNGTLFERIPSAITKMKSMQEITLSSNPIKRIMSSDFEGFFNLTYLGIKSCPLSDIADDAFRDLDSLLFLVLDNTNITTVPKAISRLRNPRSLRNVSLQYNKLVCDCESLDWMKTWIGVNTTQVFGDCVNRQNISMWEFIRVELPKCP